MRSLRYWQILALPRVLWIVLRPVAVRDALGDVDR